MIRSTCAMALLLLSACDDGGTQRADAAPDVTADAVSDTTADAAPDAAPDTATDLGPDAAPRAAVTGDGPFRVGYRTLEITYTPETFDTPRTLEISLWYPTDATTGKSAAYGLFVDRDDVLADPPPAGTEPYPVLFFSHGNGGMPQQNWSMSERAASHGWLVVAPGHTGNTIFDTDKSLAPAMFMLRPMDVSATLDAMLALPSTDPLAGRLSAQIALAGHSFGGYTTLAIGGATLSTEPADTFCATDTSGACDLWTEPRRQLTKAGFHDDRFKALIGMAPSTTGGVLTDGATAPISAPTLILTGAMDQLTPDSTDGDPLWQGLSGPQHLRVSFPTAGHYTFSNGCELGIGFGDGCGDGFIDPERALPLISALTLAWLRQHLQDDPAELARLIAELPVTDQLEITSSEAR
ncbi:MAG: hypothetical protein R3F39_09470 [Myxococcota bacterium]